jgi:hypothetical protein
MKKQNKSVTVTKNTITVNYHDNNKHFTYYIEDTHPTKQITLFGKTYKKVNARDVKQDFLDKETRDLFNDLVYARHSMTKSEINKLPLMKRYRVKVLSKQVEKALMRLKNEIVYKKIDSLLLKLFPHSPLVKQIVNIGYEDVDDLYKNDISIHSIVSEEEIAQYLYEKGLFPKFK